MEICKTVVFTLNAMKSLLNQPGFSNSMKTIFVPVRYTGKVELDKSIIARLPQTIGLVGTVQFVNALPQVQKQLEQAGKKALIGKGYQPAAGQILGCDISSAKNIDTDVEGYLYIGDGHFHPISLGVFQKPVFCYNPYAKQFKQLDTADLKKFEQRRKGAYLKFLSSERIGILVSTKQGQNNLKRAMLAKKKLEQKGKQAFIFLFDTLDFVELENFPFIECFVNTACPRIFDDFSKFPKPVINLQDVQKELSS